ncbi:MAG: beta-galactosidase [Alistipes sp.]|nr:beta-galactosidase [Alistipes sp.]
MKRFITLLLTLLLAAEAGAREIFPLNEGWRFFFKSENSSDNARHVTLPHSWNTDPTTEGNFLETTGNYLNTIYIPAEWKEQRLFVKFYGAQSVADLFVNGRHTGTHRGGATAFVFEITDKVRFGADNTLLMTVSNAATGDVLPTSTDMNRYGGLYREAELILTDRTAVSPLYLGTEGVLIRPHAVTAARAEGEAEIHLTSRSGNACTVTLDIAAPDGRKVFTRRLRVRPDDKPVVIPFSVDKPALWSPSTPALHTVTVSLGEDEAAPTDRVTVRTGFRTIVVDTQNGMRINGGHIGIRGVTLYHDNATSGGTPTAQDIDEDLQQIADLGANALRSAVMPHSRYLYDRCDERGLLVWIDIPLHRVFLSDIAYYATPAFEQNGMDQLREIVAQHLNHPSVAMWGIFSRLWTRGDDPTGFIRRLNDAAHALDPSRPTVACSDQNGDINFVTDLVVWQQNVGWERGSTDDVALWRDRLRQNWSHLRSGVAYGGNGIPGHTCYTAQNEPRSNWLPEERQTRFHEEYARNLQNDSLFWGVWINNMFDYGSARRPYGLNCEGLVSLDRRTRKDAYYLYRALWNDASPTLRLAEKRRQLRDGERQAFRIYSSAGEPLLLVGADTVAVTEYAACQYRSDTVTLQGRVEVRVSAGALRDSVTLLVGNILRQKQKPVLRRTADRQTIN